MDINDKKILALTRLVSASSKFIVSGSTLAITAILLFALSRDGYTDNAVSVPILNVKMPETLAIKITAVISIAMGWIAWLLLIQAKKLWYQLEDNGVDFDTKNTALMGASLIALSIPATRMLCILSFFLLYFVMNSFSGLNIFLVIVLIPYILLGFGNILIIYKEITLYTSAVMPYLVKWLLKDSISSLEYKLKSLNEPRPISQLNDVSENKISELKIKITDILSSKETYYPIGLEWYAFYRRYGFAFVFHIEKMAKIINLITANTVAQNIDTILKDEIPDVSLKDRVFIRNFIGSNFSSVI